MEACPGVPPLLPPACARSLRVLQRRALQLRAHEIRCLLTEPLSTTGVWLARLLHINVALVRKLMTFFSRRRRKLSRQARGDRQPAVEVVMRPYRSHIWTMFLHQRCFLYHLYNLSHIYNEFTSSGMPRPRRVRSMSATGNLKFSLIQ